MTGLPKLDRLPGLRQLPGRLAPASSDLVFFDAWQGRVCDNPRAIHEELRRRDPARPTSWTVAPGTAPPAGARGVAPGGVGFLRDVGRARAVVTNNTLPGYFRKARGARYIQAWHGTPLKRIAFDLPQPWPRDARRYLRHVAADVSKWDYLVSPSPFATEVLRRAFRYDGEVLETGYPRNDLLANDTGGETRRRTREGLGIRDEDHVILYAPTFRDDGTPSFGADPERMVERLGESTVVLVRAHSLVADQVAGCPTRGSATSRASTTSASSTWPPTCS